MLLRNIQQIKYLAGQRVLLRLDLNVPLDKKGRVLAAGAWRLQRSLPTIQYLLRHQAKVIIVAHLGRPQGRIVPAWSLWPVAKALGRLLKKNIALWPHDFKQIYKQSLVLPAGAVVMLENIRFQPGEQKGDSVLAQRLAKLADLYVGDAFANIHRPDSSMLAVTKHLPSYAGLLLQDEIKYLSRVLQAKSKLAVILGGAKISSKIKLIKKFVQHGSVFLGGALANTVLKARGYKVGKSLVDDSGLAVAKKLNGSRLHLPTDVVVANNLDASKSRTVKVSRVPARSLILDLGPQTISQYLKVLHQQKIIVWNGPLGYFENKKFRAASRVMLLALAKLKVEVIIGGGETVAMVNQLKLQKKFSFVSTGGGAMLAYLEGTSLPSLDVLYKK